MRLGLGLVVAILLMAAPVRAEPETATFALIIGVNRGADRNLPPLRYADDDAARYQELFRLLGARTQLLARLDVNTRRLHPQAAAEASVPRRVEIERALVNLAGAVRRARQRGIRTVLYFLFAGHGVVDDGGQAYLLLEDARIDGKKLAEAIARVHADVTHVIVDACHSGLLTLSRGPGGRRRPLSGFSQVGSLLDDRHVGLLLSTTSGRKSHEWEAFQAGVFSHEIRSGLYGAADANLDGIVTYREIAAFVARANDAVPNERFRSDVYARPPAGSELLVDVRRAFGSRLRVRSKTSAHWLLESDSGVRIADFHPAAAHEMHVVRPPGSKLYLRSLPVRDPTSGTRGSRTLYEDVEREYAIPPTGGVIELADLEESTPRVASRGAAHDSFSLLFALPFDGHAVRGYRFPAAPIDDEGLRTAGLPGWRRSSAIVAFGVSAAAAAVGVSLALASDRIRSDSEAGASQRAIAERNDRASDRQLASYFAFGGSGVAALTGAGLLLWPTARASEGGRAPSVAVGLSYAGRFE